MFIVCVKYVDTTIHHWVGHCNLCVQIELNNKLLPIIQWKQY